MTRHVHKLKRHIYKSTGNAVYFCVDGDCTFKLDVGLSLGKSTVCWRCGDTFQMNQYSIRLAKPHCLKCHVSKAGTRNYVNADTVRKITEILPELKDDGFDRRRDERNNKELYLVGEVTDPKELRERLDSIKSKTKTEEDYPTIESDEIDPEL